MLDPEDPNSYCSTIALKGKVPAGTLCLIRPEQIHPTQHALGKGMFPRVQGVRISLCYQVQFVKCGCCADAHPIARTLGLTY